MYKRIIATTILALIETLAVAQDKPLESFNIQRNHTVKSGMLVLGSWAALNIAGNSFMMNRTTGRDYYFSQMNVFWNLVNLGIAGAGYYNAHRSESSLDLSETVSEQYKMQKILLFNAGLDLAYIATGAYLNERAKTSKNDDRLSGYGKSIIIQGAFLFTFDTVMFLVLNKQNEKLRSFFKNLRINPDGIGYLKTF